MSGPLAGLVLVDLTRALAGPYCTMLFADLGADVIKVEPLGGDMSREQGPFRADDERREYGGYFQSINRNKRGIAVDLATPDGKQVLLDLVRGADALIENFRPGVADRLGLSYELLARHNPRLVYGAIRGFGDPRTGAGPYVDRPAFDVVAQAMGGVMHITGATDGPPTKIGPGIGDIFPAVLTAFGVMSAVWEARATGRGRFVDVAMYDAMISLAERVVHQHSYTEVVPAREGNDHPILCPFGVFRAADGWVAIAAPLDKQWRTLCSLMGVPGSGTDPRFATNAARLKARDEVRVLIEGWTSLRTRSFIVDRLAGSVPTGPVNSVADIVADPQTLARGMLIELDQPGSAEPVRVAGTPIKFTGPAPGRHRRAPLTGEHTVEVLAALGYSTGRIRDLLAAGAVHAVHTAEERPMP